LEEVTVYIEADVNPTESEDKVKRAIENLFGAVEINVEPMYRGAKITSMRKGPDALTKLRNLLRRERIRAAARTVLIAGIDRNAVSFCLNKQVAYVGHASFCQEEAESPLGPIKVKIESENPRRLIDWLISENV
jgi:predicted RNA binding protein with dsRBD fold (UPF0201 family)